jgi:hypothetical protein
VDQVYYREVACVTGYICFQNDFLNKINSSTTSNITMFYNMQVKGFISGYLDTSKFHYKSKILNVKISNHTVPTFY